MHDDDAAAARTVTGAAIGAAAGAGIAAISGAAAGRALPSARSPAAWSATSRAASSSDADAARVAPGLTSIHDEDPGRADDHEHGKEEQRHDRGEPIEIAWVR